MCTDSGRTAPSPTGVLNESTCTLQTPVMRTRLPSFQGSEAPRGESLERMAGKSTPPARSMRVGSAAAKKFAADQFRASTCTSLAVEIAAIARDRRQDRF